MDFISKNTVEKSFDDYVAQSFQDKPTVTKFILNHERKKLCIENLFNEIEKMEAAQPALLKADHLVLLGREYARMFSQNALKLAEEEAMHYLDKQKQIAEANAFKETMDMFDSVDSSEVLK